MKVYDTQDIRNVVFLGHGGSGKTTLAEALAFATGAITRQGSIEDGNTISDFDKEEIKRKFSISASVIPIEWNDLKINILDAPGYFDFVGQAEEAMSVADAAVIVVNGKAGVEVGTIKAWQICERRKIPRLFFVTNMDDPNADYMNTVNQLKEMFGKKIAPFHLPIIEDNILTGYVNVVKMGGRKFTEKGEYVEGDIPDSVMDELNEAREKLMEAVAESDDALMEKYFAGEEFTYPEISQALRKSVIECDIVPVQIGSGITCKGVNSILQSFEKYFPSPDKSEVFKKGVVVSTGEEIEADKDNNKPVSAYVFKTIMDPFVGKYSLVKVCTGVLKAGETVYNATKEVEERLAKLYVMSGKNVIEVPELRSGDIGAIGKLASTRTGDTLSTRDWAVEYHKTTMTVPYTYMSYRAASKGDEDKMAQALIKLCIEDLTLKTVSDEENRQSLLYGVGDQQLDVVVSKMKEKFKVDMILEKPRFAFRETIKKKASAQGKHKKQSGGHGQYGDVIMEFEPSGDLDTPYIFEEKVFGGAVPKNYFPAVEKGIQECVLKGPLAGYPVVGIKATLTDGSYHPVDSSEMAFKMAATIAFKEAFMKAGPILLEPISTLTVVVPDKYTGDVMGDLNKNRGRVLGMNPIGGGITEITADIPSSELYGYSTKLRSMTGGAGDFSYQFARYEQAPPAIQEKEIENRTGN
ncbi:MAG: elongation factor G [Lachnospiraceae bacterium]|nr:elongation factor G [Lachnospiraceae bacterium]